MQLTGLAAPRRRGAYGHREDARLWSVMYAQNDPAGSNTFDLRASLVVLRRRKWTLIVVILVVVGLGLLSSFRKANVYEATATALLKASSAESLLSEQTSSDPERRVQNEAQLIESAETQRAVEEQLGFSASVSVAAGGDNDVLEITATGGDPERVALIANTYAQVHLDRRVAESLETVTNAKQEVRTSLQQLEEAAAATSAQLIALTQQRATALDPALIATLTTQINDAQQTQETQRQAAVAYNDRLSQLDTEEGLALSRPPIEVLDPASEPSSPVSPNHRQDLTLALVLGILLGIAVAFVQEHLDDTIRDLDDLAEATRGLPSLAVIPLHEGVDEHTILTAAKPMSHTAESYRSLRTSLEFLALESRIKTIQITSAQAGEGKTTSVVNLAAAFAQAGEKVIVVDCDLRRPRLHEYFGLDRHVGFTSVLLGEKRVDDVIRPAPDFPDLSVLAAGPLAPNPSELLGGDTFTAILKHLADAYSIVLLDSPPILPVTDALVLSRSADATLMLAASGMSSSRRVKRSVDSLRQVGAPLVGTVLSAAPHEVAYGYVDYGYVAYGPSTSQRYGFSPVKGSKTRLRTKTKP